jgi:hypothetical protein
VVKRLIHPVTGRQVAVNHSDGAILEKLVREKLPANELSSDYDEQGRIRLSPAYHPWLQTADNWLGGRAIADQEANGESEARIASPIPGTTYFLNYDLPTSSHRIPLKCSLAGENRWSSDSLEIEIEGQHAYAVMKEGRHAIALHDLKTGRTNQTWIIVKEL